MFFNVRKLQKGYGNWSYEMYLKGKQDKEWASFQYTTIQGGMVSAEEIEQAKTRHRY
jgi:hypothetical protein